MKAEIEQKSKTKLKARVEIPARRVNQKLEEIYRKASKDMKLPGFRRGKVPRGLLKARFGKEMFHEDTQTELIKEYLPQALEELNTEPVSEPDTEVIEFDQGKPFKFRIEVEILPEPELAKYVGVEIEDPGPPEVKEEEIELELENMRRENAVLVPKEEGEICLGDVVILADLNSKEEFEFEVSEEKDISPMLIGKKKDEEIELPDYDTRFKILELKKVNLTENDELAHELGYEALEDLKDELREKLDQAKKEIHQKELSLKILDRVVSQSELEIPPGMVNRIIGDNLKAFRKKANDSSLTLDDLYQQKDLSEEEYRRQIIKEIKRKLVLEEIKKREGIQIKNKELANLAEEKAKKLEVNPLKFKNLLKAENGALENFREEKENEKVLHLLRKNAKLVTGD